MLQGACVGEDAGARNIVFCLHIFSRKVAAGGDEGQLLCAGGRGPFVSMFFFAAV